MCAIKTNIDEFSDCGVYCRIESSFLPKDPHYITAMSLYLVRFSSVISLRFLANARHVVSAMDRASGGRMAVASRQPS